MLASIKGHLIGKSEVRHAQGGFILTFQTQSALGSQEIKAWIPEAEGEKFPFGKDAEGNDIEQKEYSIIFTDLDTAADGPGAAMQAHIDELEEEVSVSGEKLAEATEANAALEDELTAKKTELANVAEELDATKTELLAAKEAEANLRGEVETLQARLDAAKQPATTPAPEVADVTGAGQAGQASASTSTSTSANSSEGQSA